MRFETWSKRVATLSVDWVVVGVFEEGELAEQGRCVDEAAAGRLQELVSRGDFSRAYRGDAAHGDVPGIAASRVLLTGICTPRYGRAGARTHIAGTAWEGGARKDSTGRPMPLLADFLLCRARI